MRPTIVHLTNSAEKHNSDGFNGLSKPRMLTCEIIPGPATNLMIWFSITVVSAVFSGSNTTILCCLSLNWANERQRPIRGRMWSWLQFNLMMMLSGTIESTHDNLNCGSCSEVFPVSQMASYLQHKALHMAGLIPGEKEKPLGSPTISGSDQRIMNIMSPVTPVTSISGELNE